MHRKFESSVSIFIGLIELSRKFYWLMKPGRTQSQSRPEKLNGIADHKNPFCQNDKHGLKMKFDQNIFVKPPERC